MRGVILAAGRGSRLNRLTRDKPKPFVELAGKTLFEWQNAALSEAGINDIAVVTGYRASCFEMYQNIQFRNRDWAKTNMVSSLLCADSWLSADDCIVSYGDIVYHPDIIRQLKQAQGQIAISYDTAWYLLWSLRFAEPLDDAESFRQQDGCLQDIGRKVSDIEEIDGQYMGLILIRQTGWNRIKQVLNKMPLAEIHGLDMTTLLRKLLEADIEIQVIPVTGRWLEVDNMEDLDAYRQQLLSASQWLHDWRWRETL